MNQTTTDANRSQKFLHYVGTKRMERFGVVATANASAVDVRWEGVRAMATTAIEIIGAVALGSGLVALGTSAFDKSPTNTLEDRMQSHAETHTHASLHPDPQQAVVHVQPPVSR